MLLPAAVYCIILNTTCNEYYVSTLYHVLASVFMCLNAIKANINEDKVIHVCGIMSYLPKTVFQLNIAYLHFSLI